MTLVLLQCLTGLTNAMFLFLVASGLSLIFGVTRIINFAHGSFFMVGAYAAATLAAAALPLGAAGYYLGALLASLAVALLGGLVEFFLLRRIYRVAPLYQLLLTFALVLVTGDAVRFFWGPENRLGPPPPGLSGSISVLGQPFPTYDLVVLLVGPAVAGGLWWLLHRTRWGILIRAATADREMVGALGVKESRLFTGVFILGSWLAGLAGALQMPRQALTTVMDSTVIAEAFVVVVVGGMGSPLGALLGALLIGLLQAVGILWLPREFHLVIAFLLMAVVLVFRPWGLLGRPLGHDQGEEGRAPEPHGSAGLPRWLLGATLLAFVALPPLLPTFFIWLLVEILAFALFAASLQLLIGSGGMISFGHAAYFGVGAYGAALWMQQGGLPMPVAFLLGPLASLLAALLFGLFCVRLSGVYFAMLTLAFAQIAYAVVHQWYDVTGGDNGILGVWPSSSLASPLRYYYLALLAGGIGLAFLRRVTASPFGITLRAARDHATRCEALGVNVRTHQLMAFSVAGLCAGLGGTIFVFLKGSAFPDYLGIPVSVESLVMVLLGGLQSPAGAPAGAALYLLLHTFITKYTGYWQAALGGMLILLVLVFPQGLGGWLAEKASREETPHG